MTREDAEALCTVLGLDAAKVIRQKKNAAGNWKGERMIVVDFGVINKRIKILGMTKAEVTESCGYSPSWLYISERNGGRIRTRAAIDLCDLLGLKLEDIIIPEKQPEPEPVPEPVQPEADGAADAVELTTPIAIDQADAIVAGLADAVSNQTADIIEHMDALAGGIMRLNEKVDRVLDDYAVYLNRFADKIEKVLDKMEELKS